MLFMEKITLAAFGLTLETSGTVVIDTKELVLLKFTFPERKDAAEIRATLVKREQYNDFILDNILFTDYLQGDKSFSLAEIHALCSHLVDQQTKLQPLYSMIYDSYETAQIGLSEE